jgi:SPP1 family predicted phage head-tail adaptor
MDAGKRRTQITILTRDIGKDASNQPLKTWSTVVRRPWANVLHKNGAQTIRSDAPTSVLQASMRIPWCTDVTAAMRVQIGSASYDIQAVIPDLGQRKYVDLVCQLVVGRV